MLSLDSRYFARVRLKAMWGHVWFNVLSSLERGLVDFVIRVSSRPKSQKLIESLARIIVRVKMAMMRPLRRLMEEIGRLLAKRISTIALKWGNKNAAELAEDKGFIRYLTIVDMNNILGFRLSKSLLMDRRIVYGKF